MLRGFSLRFVTACVSNALWMEQTSYSFIIVVLFVDYFFFYQNRFYIFNDDTTFLMTCTYWYIYIIVCEMFSNHLTYTLNLRGCILLNQNILWIRLENIIILPRDRRQQELSNIEQESPKTAGSKLLTDLGCEIN